MDLKKLAEPFPASDVEWRVGRAGTNDKGVWATVLAYITNRAIMQRLDDVCGPANWRNEFRYEQGGAVLCGISVLVDQPNGDWQWVTKWDGAENTDIEKVKGGLSGSMKRAAVQWGIGRYLYDLEEGYAKVGPNGKHYQGKNDKKNIPAFKWDPPSLPAWALPSEAKNGAGVKSANAADSERSTRGESGGGTDSAVTTQPARQKAAPASSPTKVPEGLKLNGVRMATMSNEELEKLIKDRASDAKYAKHVMEATTILASRTLESKFAAEHADQDTLQFR